MEMSNKKQQIPAIRFNGFTDAWEQRKLGEISESYSGGTPSVANHSYYGGSIPFIRSAEINSKNTELYLTEEGLNNSSAKLVEEGDILYALYGATSGEVGISQINGAINQAILAIKPKIEYDSNFIMQWLRRQKNSIISTYLQGGQGNLSGGIVKDLTLYAPTEYEEQTKIGSFFKQLDNTIALHQRQLNNHKELKKTLLQKMFPQNGEKLPQVRFDGFTEVWEQRNVSEITKFHKQGYYTKETYGDNKKYFLLRGTEMTSNKLVLNETPKINATEKDYQDFKVEKGDFLIVRSGTVGTYGIVYDDIKAIFGSYLINFRFDKSVVTNEFFGLFYQSELFKSQLNKIIQKSSNVNINAENIKSINIKIPSIEEQQKIGSFFKQLDETIALHQQKLNDYKQLKKFMLQKMFI